MRVASMHQQVDAHSPIPIRWQLTAPRNHGTEGDRAPRNPALPSIRELAGLLGINPNPRVRAIEDLKRSGYRPLLPLTAN
jgi:DNA-binding transcriptional regulator YhcF (GntR family)